MRGYEPEPFEPKFDAVGRACEKQREIADAVPRGEEAAQFFIVGSAPRLAGVGMFVAHFRVWTLRLLRRALQFGEDVLKAVADGIERCNALVDGHGHTLSEFVSYRR